VTIDYRAAVFVTGVLVAAYWARVLKMARKAGRKTGRAANLWPAEKTGKVVRLIWAPIVLIWVAQPLVVSLATATPWVLKPVTRSAWVAWPAAAIVAACFWATRICWRTMGKSWRMGIDPAERTAVVTGGPFARVRHPIYALSQAMMLTTVIAVPSPLMFVTGATHLLLLQWEARREEAYMAEVHGQDYVNYASRIGRFVPRLRFPHTAAKD